MTQTNNDKTPGQYFTKNFVDQYVSIEKSILFQDLLKPTIEHYVADAHNKTIYDAGCGSGFYFKVFSDKGIKSYTGIDLDSYFFPSLFDYAKKKSFKNIHLIKGSTTEDYQFVDNGPFDVVISVAAMYAKNSNELLSFCKHLYDATKKGGIGVLVVLNMEYVDSELMDKFNISIAPKLQKNEKYPEFSEYVIKLRPPFIEEEFDEHEDHPEYVVYKDTLLKTLEKVGFITEVGEFVVSEGKKELLEFAKSLNKNVFLLKK